MLSNNCKKRDRPCDWKTGKEAARSILRWSAAYAAICIINKPIKRGISLAMPKYHSIIQITRCPYHTRGIKPRVESIKKNPDYSVRLRNVPNSISIMMFLRSFVEQLQPKQKQKQEIILWGNVNNVSGVSRGSSQYMMQKKRSQCSHALTELLSTLFL